jgi:hypothetical protein
MVKIQTKYFLLATLPNCGEPLDYAFPLSHLFAWPAGARLDGGRAFFFFLPPYSIVVLLFTRTLFEYIIAAAQYLTLAFILRVAIPRLWI